MGESLRGAHSVCVDPILIIKIIIKINNRMGISKTKSKSKTAAKPHKKVLTKGQKVAKRVTKIQKMMEYRKKLKRANKGKVVPIKKKRQQ